jgi:hypothetical protein
MTTMKTTIVILALFIVLLATGCGGYGNDKSPGGGTTNSGPGY